MVILSQKKNGRFLTQDITGHFEYMLNTLSFDLKGYITNPFEDPASYPALLFRISDQPFDLGNSIPESSSESSEEDNQSLNLIDSNELNNEITNEIKMQKQVSMKSKNLSPDIKASKTRLQREGEFAKKLSHLLTPTDDAKASGKFTQVQSEGNSFT